MDLSDPKFIVAERIELIEKLLIQKDYFINSTKTYVYNNYFVTSPFRHYSSLTNYLSLTCFDILGQNREHVEFLSWLNSKKKIHIDERSLESSDEENTLEEKMKQLYQKYILLYGTKNSFYDFILKKINAEQKAKLLNSIRGSRRISEHKTWIDENGNQVTKPQGNEKCTISEIEKLKFLYKMRNSFTHKGHTIGESYAVLWRDEYLIKEENDNLDFSFSAIYEEFVGKELISYEVSNWPWLLIEILKEYCDSDNLLTNRYVSKENQNPR